MVVEKVKVLEVIVVIAVAIVGLSVIKVHELGDRIWNLQENYL